MNPADQLYLAALEDMRPDQLDALLSIAQKKDTPLAKLIVTTMREGLARMNWCEREEAIQIFRESGIDLDQI